MKTLLTSLAVAAAVLLTGCGAAAEAAPASAEIQEDDPGWNCLLHGNKVCGPQPGDEVEAWSRLDPAVLPTNDTDFRVTYLGKALVGIHFPPSDYYTVESSTGAMVHVFRVEKDQK